MKYLLISLLVLLTGCELIPNVIDESITLPVPVILDLDGQSPRPSPAPDAGTPEPAKVEVPKQPAKAEVPPVKAPPTELAVKPSGFVLPGSKPTFPKTGHWTFPARDRTIENHLRTTHGVVPAGMDQEAMLDLHDALHTGKASPVQASSAPVAVSTVQQFSIASCGICKADFRDVLPQWRKQGWTILEPIDETANPRGLYPRYEIRGADGSFRVHTGTLRGWK